MSSSAKNIFGFVFFIAVASYAGYAHYQLGNMQMINKIGSEARYLTDDSFKELFMITMANIRDNQLENIKNTGKVEGMLAVISNQKPQDSETSALWHAGYYRGIDQSQDMAAISYETGYHAALDDINCPPSRRPNSDTIRAKSPYNKDSLESEEVNKVQPVSNNDGNSKTKITPNPATTPKK